MKDSQEEKIDEVLGRVRRFDTRQCLLMEHHGLHPLSNGMFALVGSEADQESERVNPDQSR